MQKGSGISLRKRIYISFALLSTLFVINAVITVVVLNKNKKEHKHISNVTDPSIEALHDLRKIMRESMMFTTNWIFIRSAGEDKKGLKELQEVDYPALKIKLTALSAKWYETATADSLKNIFHDFEDLIKDEQSIMGLLQQFEDYNDPIKKFSAEDILESVVIPKINLLSKTLNDIMQSGRNLKFKEEKKLAAASVFLRTLIFILAISTVCLGIFFSIYMAKRIIVPIRQIYTILNDLGKGIIRPINIAAKGDEVGEMIWSVNNLSSKLSHTAAFASEIGNRNFDFSYEPLSNEDTLGKALIAMRDNLKINEENISKKNKELERKNKELEQFAYVASHDLQEPLRTISSFVNLLKDQYYGKLEGHADRYITYITQSSERMKILINDLLEYSRLGNKKELQEIDCNNLIHEVLADLDKKINDEQAVITVEKLPVIKGYRTEMKQLFQNLIVNAIKFKRKDTIPEINITANHQYSQWSFAISDNGIGIPEEHRERIFIIFQRLHTRTEYEGSGIGLAHCKKIVGLHGGKIWVDSAPGEGTTFNFNIPEIHN